MASDDRLRELEEKYEGYKVYDNRGEKIGKVDDLFIDESDREEYIGVKMGLFGTKSTLIPMDIVRVNESDRAIEVSESKDRVKDAPNFGDDDDITPDYEDRIRSHFGLQSLGETSSRGSHGGAGAAGAASVGDRETSHSQDTGDSGPRDYDGGQDRETGASSGVDTDYGERAGSSERADGDSGRDRDESYARDEDTRGSSVAGDGGSDQQDRDSGESGGVSRTFRSGGSSDHGRQSASGGLFGEGEERGVPVNRQTEQTETFQEGGRTRIRRRIIREEIIEEDSDQR